MTVDLYLHNVNTICGFYLNLIEMLFLIVYMTLQDTWIKQRYIFYLTCPQGVHVLIFTDVVFGYLCCVPCLFPCFLDIDHRQGMAECNVLNPDITKGFRNSLYSIVILRSSLRFGSLGTFGLLCWDEIKAAIRKTWTTHSLYTFNWVSRIQIPYLIDGVKVKLKMNKNFELVLLSHCSVL